MKQKYNKFRQRLSIYIFPRLYDIFMYKKFYRVKFSRRVGRTPIIARHARKIAPRSTAIRESACRERLVRDFFSRKRVPRRLSASGFGNNSTLSAALRGPVESLFIGTRRRITKRNVASEAVTPNSNAKYVGIRREFILSPGFLRHLHLGLIYRNPSGL